MKAIGPLARRAWHGTRAAAGLALLLLVAACAVEAPVATRTRDIPVFPPPPEAARFVWERSLRSSADIVPDDADASLRRLVTGEVKTGEGLAKPYGVAVRSGRVFVGDTVSRTVLMFDLAARKVLTIGVDDPGALRMPFGLDVDAQGNLYVLDGSLKRVHVYDAQGKFVRMLGQDLKWSRPAGLALDEKRRRVYVVDAGGVDSNDHLVRALDLGSGRELFTIGRRGDGPGEFNLPRDAAVAPDGTLYVVDGGNFRVQVFGTDGKFQRMFGTIGRQGGQFSRPKEIAIDAGGRVYVVDTAFGNFQIFDAAGALLLDVGLRGSKDEPARFMLPSGIAVDVDGRVYMADQFFRKVEVFRPAAATAGAGYGVAALAELAARAAPAGAASATTPAIAPATGAARAP